MLCRFQVEGGRQRNHRMNCFPPPALYPLRNADHVVDVKSPTDPKSETYTSSKQTNDPGAEFMICSQKHNIDLVHDIHPLSPCLQRLEGSSVDEMII